MTPQLQQIRAVHASAGDFDEDLVTGGLGGGSLDKLERTGAYNRGDHGVPTQADPPESA